MSDLDGLCTGVEQVGAAEHDPVVYGEDLCCHGSIEIHAGMFASAASSGLAEGPGTDPEALLRPKAEREDRHLTAPEGERDRDQPERRVVLQVEQHQNGASGTLLRASVTRARGPA